MDEGRMQRKTEPLLQTLLTIDDAAAATADMARGDLPADTIAEDVSPEPHTSGPPAA
jgi:hypothetical protein